MKFLIGFILFYVLLIVLLFIKQRDLIYFPDNTKPVAVEGVDVVKVKTKDNIDLEAWYIAPSIENKPVIIFFHGNAGNYSHRIHKSVEYLNAGYGVLLAGYRGYGANSGTISEAGFYNDGRAYIDWLLQEKNIKLSQIVIYGESIGSGVAVQMATEYDISGLILEVPFSSLLEVATKRYFFVPVKFLLKDKFMNLDKIKGINAPLLIMHGVKDKVIPFDLSKKLFDKAKQPKKFVDFPLANHNNLYDFGASAHVLDFLASINSNNRDNSVN